MARAYLLDSNSIIDFIGNKIPHEQMIIVKTIVRNVPNVSVITQIEVLGFNFEGEEEIIFKDFFQDANVFLITEDVVNKTIELRKKYKIKLPDALIAATALVNNFDIISRNVKDFSRIKGLVAIDPNTITSDRINN